MVKVKLKSWKSLNSFIKCVNLFRHSTWIIKSHGWFLLAAVNWTLSHIMMKCSNEESREVRGEECNVKVFFCQMHGLFFSQVTDYTKSAQACSHSVVKNCCCCCFSERYKTSLKTNKKVVFVCCLWALFSMSA